MDILGVSAIETSHPLNVGMVGMHGNYAPNLLTNECDFLACIGMRFDDRVTGDLSTYAKQAKIIHFEIDPAEVNKNVEVDVAVMGSVKHTSKRFSASTNQKHIPTGSNDLKSSMQSSLTRLSMMKSIRQSLV